MITLDTDNKPHKKKVKVGIRNADEVQITEGLKGGERVVTVGAFELDSEKTMRSREDDHPGAGAQNAGRGRR